MGKTSRSRASTQIRGVAESRLRTKSKQTFQSDTDAQSLLTKERVRAYLDAFMCPWCERGPFKVIAMHTSRAHGVGAKELRDMAGLYYCAVLTDPDTHEKNVRRGSSRDMTAVRAGRTPGDQANAIYSSSAKADYGDSRRRKRELSDAAKERNRKQLDAARAKGIEASAEASRVAAERRFTEARPVILAAYESKMPLSEVAKTLGVSGAQVGRWARRMGLPDGRALAAQWREFPKEALLRGRHEAEAQQREIDAIEWQQSDKSRAQISLMAKARGVSDKGMTARLRAIGFDLGDGRKRADRIRRSNYPEKRTHCDVAGCQRQHVARGMCRYHYQKWRIENGKVPECSKEGCSSPVVGKGLCSKHYARGRSAK